MGLAAPTAGELVLRLAPGLPVAAALRRPQALVDSLAGQAVDRFLTLLPLLFPLCGLAHGVAALRAVEAAAGRLANAAQEHARELIARADAVAMHVWRTALDWPEALGEPTDIRPVAAARRIAQSLPRRLYPAGDWLVPGGGQRVAPGVDLAAEIGELGAIAAALDAPGRAAALCRMFEGRFARDPALGARLAARLNEQVLRFERDLAALRAWFAGRVPPPEHGRRDGVTGIGTVATARGPLEYRIELDDGRVHRCRSSAPTDVAFAPGSAALADFAALIGDDAETVALARYVALAHDPCVPVRIERQADGVEHA